ncbi:PREDICTED: endogenous Bornavirus-like nucleoprotein 1-like [Chrysochloris asiatica]|uniref:Endogenous Bornavirus-like nucleoprotein 1-like n=1 Tax=Chrysochloris asiatica TaxID=185453 RepID=A0A9B0T966_CHRAS|nr:PREDICTED: endogenous Bornavirus-like nucleoprotein 1-like [Chrysochloris asiatica]
MFNHEHRSRFHPVTASLVFMCYLIPGLWEALNAAGVHQRSYLAAPVKDGDRVAYETLALHLSDVEDRSLSALEMSALLGHCCTLLIGVVIGSSEKIRSGSEQIKRWFKTLMVTLNKQGHSKTATALDLYPPSSAIDWINSQPWAGNLILGLLMTTFESPGRELMDQIRMVASYAQMTTYSTIKQYLDQCMDATLALPAVASEIPKFLYTEQDLRSKLGEWFEFMGAIRHPEVIKLAPRSFPNLSSAALFWSRKESATVTAFRAPVIQLGSSLTESLLTRARRREIVRSGIGGEMTPNIKKILGLVGVTGYATDK